MNHYALPYPFTADEEPNARYGAWAIEGLYECLLEQGSRPAHLEAKLFGGAALIPAPQAQLDIGGRNVALGLSELRRLGVPLKARRTGGQHGLLLHFRTDTAEVLLRRAGG
nr:chemotaxis protein CheD [Roseomonas sp. GC11]